jgi:ribosomal-protein-alanine N-acetyltransferase
MTNIITIREYEPKDKHDVIDLIRLSTPDYFAAHEEKDFNRFLETERELFYVLPMDGQVSSVRTSFTQPIGESPMTVLW